MSFVLFMGSIKLYFFIFSFFTFLEISKGDFSISCQKLFHLNLNGKVIPANSSKVDYSTKQSSLNSTRLTNPRITDKVKDYITTFQLTETEAIVLYWVSQSKSNNEIGDILNISPRTAQKHTENIFTKLNLASRYEAVRLVYLHENANYLIHLSSQNEIANSIVANSKIDLQNFSVHEYISFLLNTHSQLTYPFKDMVIQTLKEAPFNLTSKQSEILFYYSHGFSDINSLAQLLNASPRTINKHFENINEKLQLFERSMGYIQFVLNIEKQIITNSNK